MNTPTLTAEAERTDAIYQRACEVEHELRAEVERLRSDRDCEKRIRKDAEELREDAIARAEKAERAETVALANWNGSLERAMKAEADLIALGQCHDDNCRALVKIAAELAAERARLDWLESPAGFDWQWHSAHSVLVRRAAIDAAMKEDAK